MHAHCKDCNKKVDGVMHGSYSYHDSADGPPRKITLLNCPRCQHAIVTEEIEQWHDMWSTPKTVYPIELSGLSEEIPEVLRNSFNEATSCFNARSFNASAIMCRRTLEGLCSELGIKGHNLNQSLNTLAHEGFIEGSITEWADALRIAGNEAAHDVSCNISSLDAQNILEFTEALLDYVYVFKRKFEAFKKRRDDGKSA
jgi:Domain of unknown function (DUF4145)